MSKVRLSTEWLNVCGGCHVAVVDLHEKILNVLDAVEIVRSPVLTDTKGFPEADVGLVSGAVRTDHDAECAEKMRKSCNKIIAFGTCAVHGGISGASCVHTDDEIYDAVYRKNKTTKTETVPSNMVPILQKVTPVDEIINVDLYLPGCPPHPFFIFESLIALVQGKAPRTDLKSVCSKCERTMKKTDVSTIKKEFEGVPDDDTCLLCQGYLCFGSVSLNRCLSPCPNNSIVCTGCAGPTPQVLSEPNRDIRTEIALRMSKLTNIKEIDIRKHIEQFSKTHYAYAMATRMIGEKPTFLINKWIKQNEVSA